MNKMRRLGILIAIATLVVGVGGVTHALKAPHDYASVGNCGACHAKGVAGASFVSITSFQTLCFNSQIGCHFNSRTAQKKALTTRMVSNRFKNIVRNSQYAAYSTTKTQSSHGWKIPNTNPDAGATVDWRAMPEYKGVVAPLNNKITCTRCHRAHGDFGPSGQTIYRSFLKADPKGDNICFQCHAARRINNVRSYNAEVASGTKHYSHPVEVNYSSVGAAKPGYFQTTPTLTVGYNASARPRLYTTIGGVKGAVVCSTCHGPLHAADSNPYTFDNLTSYNMRAYSSSAGNLLRQYPMSKAGHENNLCKSCHKVSAHKSFNKCSDCHEPHKKAGDTNLYLIKKIIATPYGNHSVFFTSTSHMAKRYGIYSLQGGTRTKRSTAICQVCHRSTSHNRAYSTVGADRTHNYLSATNSYNNCVRCHAHVNANSTGAFKAAGCGGCHMDPPTIGRHTKHVGDSIGLDTWNWETGTMSDQRSDSSYGFSCGRCHSPWTPYTATAGSGKYDGRNHYGLTSPTAQKIYTADVGFKNTSPLPANPFSASYYYGGAGTPDTTSGAPYFRTPTAGTCYNLYCHGQFYGGYTSNTPNFNDTATQSCVGSCHGTNAAKLPGVNGTGEWGAHKRHIGSVQYVQYGYGTPNFRCNACHYATAIQNRETTITSRKYHVNGKTNVRFAPAYGDSASTYNGLNDYTSATNTTLGSKTAYKGACSKIYCHSDGSRKQGGYSSSATYPSPNTLAVYPAWSSTKNFTSFGGTLIKRRCARCHGSSYKGITAYMPGYDSRPGKGNSHKKHVIDNGFMCRVCHSGTIGTDNRSIVNTTKHVNQEWDIDIISTYSGVYNSSTNTCSRVKCHGRQITSAWGTPASCQNCHLSSTGDVNKRILPRSKFTSWTSVVPKIYSTQWADKGHGRQSGSYVGYNTNNTGANKVCADCHGDGSARAGGLSTKHGTSNNPFRLYTAPDRPNILCERCHGTGGSATNSNGIFTHASSVSATGHNYAVKCIDCHDPHGDNNIFMLHSTLPRPLDTSRDVASGSYGIITSNANQVNVDFSYNQYTSDYARKTAASKVCQVCHDETKNPSDGKSRFRYYSSLEKTHGSGRCTDCHQHSAGFKGAGCNGCHGNPPTGTFNLISGAGRINATKKRASGSATYGAHTTHISVFKATGMSATQACSACHYSGMWDSGSESVDIELEFRAFTQYSGTTQEFNSGTGARGGFYGLSGIGVGAGTDNRCVSMKCHGGGGWLTASYGNVSTPIWGNSSKVKCGNCHGAKKAAGSGSWPTSKAHTKHAGTGSAGYDFMCKLCHNATVQTTATTLNRSGHVNAQANIAFDTADPRVGVQSTYTAVGKLSVNATYGKCYTLYCHSRGTVKVGPAFDYGNFTADWNVNASGRLGSYKQAAGARAKCNYCHGNRSWSGVTSAMPGYPNTSPKANRHEKHVKTYGFMCVRCHNGVVANNTSISAAGKSLHINGEYDVSFDSSNYTDYGKAATMDNTFAKYTLQTVTPFSKCKNAYCHSRGTDFTAPYSTRTSFANFTARWGDDLGSYKKAAGQKAKCNYCHGNRAYSGTTSAMPNYSTVKAKANSHKAHVVSNGLVCSICHYGVARNNTSISDATRHANRFYNISIAPGYGSGGAVKRYSSTWDTSGGTCMNVSCHGTGKPKWGSSLGCRNCHLTTDPGIKDRDNYANWSGFKGQPAQLYSSEWGQKGHGAKGKDCSNCHNKIGGIVAHGTASNPYRLYTSDANALCLDCHGTSPQRGKWNVGGFGGMTGYQTHSQANINAGGGTANASWNNYSGQSVKCIDCHDPHGDKNKKMIHAQINYTGSDRFGRPVKRAVTLMTFTTQVGSNWSSFANTNIALSICRRCHTNEASMLFMNKALYTGDHQPHQPCTNCHAHKKGFAPSGCDTCHGNPPPPGPASKNWFDSTTSLHAPHASNARNRFINGSNGGTYLCNECHGDSSNGQGTGHSNWSTAVMQQMTSKHGEWSRGGTKGRVSVIDDTCWNVNCHTPRAYTRSWKRPTGCDNCHGYTKGRGTSGLTGRQFNLQTTQSHKIHINWTANAPASRKNYKFACSNCHYNWVTNKNYSTHYSGQVNITSNGPVNTVGGQFYTRSRAFKGFTSGNESLGTCSKTYCHGNFATGTTIVKPNWKKGVTTVNCGSCHRAKTAKVAGWGTGALMPAPHPTHVNSATYNFTCARCHNWTVTNNTTVQFTYSTHVNTRKDVNFDNTSGTFTNSSKRMCQNNYCHSSGATVVPRTVSNYTADWLDGAAVNKTGAGKGCSYCHGSKGNGFGGITAAMPNYANQAHAKHARNATGDNFKCYVCHAATVSAAGAIISNTNHANKFKNISIISTYKSGQTLYSTSIDTKKTCKNIKCHGGRTTPKWTLPTGINCMDCHKSTTGDTDKRIKEINVYQSFSAAGSTAPKIYSSIWATKGHGRPTAEGVYLISGNSPADKTCTNCHGAGETRANGLATKHGTGNNPFRLITAPGRPNVLCESCHGTNATNPGKGVRIGIQTHASSVSKQGQNFDIKCIDCHDPHGDNNSYMVHSTISRPNTALSVKSQTSNTYGSILTTATTLRNVDFVNNVYTTDYAKKTQAPKICQTCHRETQKPRSSTYQRYRWNGSNDAQHGTTKCTGCHSHDSGFKGVRCDGCHGNPPTGIQTILSGANRINEFKERPSGNTSSEPNTAGAHLKHVQVFGSDSVTCSYCHQGGMYGSGSKNTNIDIGFRAFSVYSGYTQNYNGQSAVKTGFYGYSGYGVGAGTNQKCNNMKCHGGGGWLTASYGTVTAPTWTVPNTATCGKCHGAKKAAGTGSWPTTYAHQTHAGTGGTQANLMCNVCHATTVIANNTTLSDTMHVNGRANIGFGNEFRVHSTTSAYSDDGNYVNNGVAGKCTNTYCHSKGTYIGGVPYNNAANFSNFTAGWNDIRGGYKKSSPTTKAKCNYCHGNTQFVGVTSAMPGYTDGTPKANKHSKHVRTYSFLCNACHVDVARNNTSITSSSLHINRAYDVNYTTVRSIVNNSAGSYMTGRCENLYCHSLGNIASAALPNYTAKWAADMITGGYKTGMKCKYCHGSKTLTGITAAMPNYPTGAKANAHNRHVAKYGFTCTECHMKVTTNNTSIDAAGGSALHVNKQYNVYFKPAIGGRPQINNTGIYKYQSGATGSSCKNTYCHSRGTDFVRPYSTRTSFSNFTAQWGDNLAGLGYKKPAGQKAKCNYCHGNRLFSGMTSAMPNYSTQIKKNSHKKHVVGYGFTCKACHKYVTTNNSSIDAAGGIGRHVNGSYNVDFSNSFNNNTGLYDFIGLNSLNKCKNMYCHSRGTDFTRPFNTRTSFANFTARWGEDLNSLGYKKPVGQKAKCNYCHGNRAYSGTTSAMPNYSTYIKANSHYKHVVSSGYTCKTCHYGVAINNTSISDRARHVNGFYNISLMPGFRAAAGKTYSMVYNGTGGTCKNNSCHGAAGTPKWGGTVMCFDCHVGTEQAAKPIKTAANGPNPVNFQQYTLFGHGRSTGKTYPVSGTTGAGKWNSANSQGCYASESGCHSSAAAHTTKDIADPFRLGANATTINNLCTTCHAPGQAQNHEYAITGKRASWPFTPKCVDCHDPHGDSNIYMIRGYINGPAGASRGGSGIFGNPSTTQSQLSSVNFNNRAGKALNSYAQDNTNKGKGVCETCHSNTHSTPVAWYNQEGDTNAGAHSGNIGQCTAACHKHDGGFKGSGESAGGIECTDGCHQLFGKMQDKNSFHHVLSNASTTYKNVTMFGSSDMKSPARRCLMCHVDHDSFSPKAKVGNRLRRAMNLRINGSVLSIRSGINTDFWPAKRVGKYAASSPLDGPSGSNGVCISCHKNVQTKNTTNQMEDRTSKARSFSLALYTSSSHNFQILSGFNNFSGGSSFRANCTKCHNSKIMDKSGAEGQKSSRYRFGLHDRTDASLLNMTSPAGKPQIEQLCYKCHGDSSRSGGGPGDKYDYYSTVQMNSSAKMIKTAIEAKSSGHPIDSNLMAGRHKADEFYNVTGTVAANANPPLAKFWNFSTTRHVECVDCHNTHGGNASVLRRVGGPYFGKNPGYGDTSYAARPAGNIVAGAQSGAWGVKLDFTGVAKSGTPKFTKTSQVTYQYELCIKCHSNFAYGANPRGVPSGLPDPNTATLVPLDNLDPTVPQSNLAQRINPANYGYHPIYQKGKNQPAKTLNTGGTKWPAAKSNWMYKDRFYNKTAFIAVSGLSWNFVPPFSQHSLLACSDCHAADNTGKAIGRLYPTGTPTTTGTWVGATDSTKISEEGDGMWATSSTPASSINVDVIIPSAPQPTPEQLKIVAYGSTSATTANNKKQALQVYDGAVWEPSAVTYNCIGWGASIGRCEVAATNQTSWTTLNASYTAKITTNTAAANIKLDYIGLEAIYTATSDVKGPHGSLEKWILQDADKDIFFDANNNNILLWDAVGGPATDRPNGDVGDTATYGIYEQKNLCFNCHRRDVYGWKGAGDGASTYPQYARIGHPPDGGTHSDDPTLNVWGIWCMNCHAGNGVGEIHGSWANSTTNWEPAGSRINLQRPRGVRLLNGAVFAWNPVTGACYTVQVSTQYASGCVGKHWATTNTATTTPNYTYQVTGGW